MNPRLTRILSTLFPGLMTQMAYKSLTSPQIRKLRENELEVLDKANKERIAFQGFEIQTYSWGSSEGETILLIHGWEGQAGNFSDLVEKLVEAEYFVVAFDGPSHGFSSQGPTSLFEFSELAAEMIRRYQPQKLVSHSFGGVATSYALSTLPDYPIKKYLLLTTPDTFSERIDNVAAQVGITEGVKQRLVEKLEKELGIEVQELSVSNYVGKTSVEKALILHDRDDKVIAIKQSQRVVENWPVAELEEITGTGHFRILRTPEVLKRGLAFLAD